jgi:hypothetical protein
MQVPSVKKETKMSEGIKALVGRKMTKTVKFMGDDVKISKLSVQQVQANPTPMNTMQYPG